MKPEKAIKIIVALTDRGEFVLEEKREYDIIGENEKMYVIADDKFTTIYKKDKTGYGYTINTPKLDTSTFRLGIMLECAGIFTIDENEAMEKVKSEILKYLMSQIEFYENVKSKVEKL